MQALVYNLNTPKTRVDSPSAHHQLLKTDAPLIYDFTEMHLELKRLVTVWVQSGPNLRKMFDEDPELKRRTMHGRTLLIPTRTGRGHLSWLPDPPGLDPYSQKDQALMHFMDLIANPEWELLGGPCARCGKYYLKKTKRQKAYCSRTCGAAATAIPATKKRRELEHAAKISRAQRSIAKWSESKRSMKWKEWVSNKTKYTVKWLTRAANNGQLKPPKDT
jgi:hypothetical protein